MEGRLLCLIVANFIDGKDEITSSHLTMWDYGQKLMVYGLSSLPEIVEVHFSDKTTTKTIVRLASKVDEHFEVSIPDRLLENEYSIKAFVYIKNSISGETYKTINIPVIRRKQPEAYVDVDDPTVDDKLTKLLEEVASLNTKFARVYGIDDKQLSIKICEEEPEVKEDDYLYIFPDTKYEDLEEEFRRSESDLSNSIESLEYRLKQGTLEVGKATNATSSESSDFATKAEFYQRGNLFRYSKNIAINEVDDITTLDIGNLEYGEFDKGGAIKLILQFETDSGSKYQKQLLLKKLNTTATESVSFKLDLEASYQSFEVKVIEKTKIQLTFFYRGGESLTLKSIYSLPVEIGRIN